MRDPARIDDFCDRLKVAWHKVPHWRFGQLMWNLPIKKDPFYMEDDEMIELIETFLTKFADTYLN